MKINNFILNEDDIITTDKYCNYCKHKSIQYIKTDYFKLEKQFLWRNSLHPVIIDSKVLD